MDNTSEKQNINAPEGLPRLSMPLAVIMLVITGLGSFAYSAGLLPAGGLLVMILAAALNVICGLAYIKKPVMLLAILSVNLAAFAVSSIYFGSVLLGMTALYPLIYALPIVLTVAAGAGRSVSIAASAALAVVPAVITLCTVAMEAFGTLSADTINQTFDVYLNGVMEQSFNYLTEMYSGVAENEGIMQALERLKAQKDTMIYTIKVLSPSILAVSMIVTAYFVTLAARLIANIMKVGALFPSGLRVGIVASLGDNGPQVHVVKEEVQWRIAIDNISAVVFVASYILTVLFAPTVSVTPLYIVSMNLVILLCPAFAYCGARDAVLGFRGKSSVGRTSKFILIFGIILLFINPPSVLIVLSVLGVIVTFRENRSRKTIDPEQIKK